MTHIELHPLCTYFPRLEGADFDALRDDIAVNGLHDPITLLDGKILDGGNRYRACLAAGIEPKFTQFANGNPVKFVLSANLHRRHLSAGQRATIVALATDWASAYAHGGTRKNEQAEALPLERVRDRSAVSGATERTQRVADKLVKSNRAKATEVSEGKVSLYAATKPRASEKHVEKPELEVWEGPNLAELVDELQAENTRLTGLLKAAEADDLKAEAIKWKAAYDRALVSQSEAMDAAARSEKREKFTHRQLMRCGKAVGEDDIRNIAAKVEAMARLKAVA